MGNFIDLTGQTFGRWKVIKRGPNNKSNHVMWLCECQCGKKTQKLIAGGDLRSGKTKSCGCYNSQVASERKTHGLSNTRLYHIWHDMKRRTLNPNCVSYNKYGGRGIKICEEWLKLDNFIKWALENGYEDNLTIDRIDVNGDYCPENCRWATAVEQSNNKRNNNFLEYNGKKLTTAQWSKLFNISHETLRYRIAVLGWSIEKALTTPVDTKFKSKKRYKND